MNNKDLIKEFLKKILKNDGAMYWLMTTIIENYNLSDFEGDTFELCIIAELGRKAQKYVENEMYKKFGDYEEVDDEICEYEVYMWSKWLNSDSEVDNDIELYGKEQNG